MDFKRDWKTLSWNYGVVPGIMGVFFGIGHFLAYYFFHVVEPEKHVSKFIENILWYHSRICITICIKYQ